jgi:hypothetical protein
MAGDASPPAGAGQRGDQAVFLPGYGLVVPAIGFLLLAALVSLYEADWLLYIQVLRNWVVLPYRYPFLDLESIPASISCWQQGIDVYVRTTCDVLGRPFNYSPLWLRLSFIPAEGRWTPWLGLGLASLFLLSLGILPRPKSGLDRALVILGTYSSPVAYAIERGNADLIMFLLVMGAALLLRQGLLSRLAGYGVILLGGALKFYPLVALVVLARERPRIAIPLVVAAAGCIGGFIWYFGDELVRAMDNIPRGGQFGDNWGALDFQLGIKTALMPVLTALHVSWLESSRLSDLASRYTTPVLTIFAIFGAFEIALRQNVRAALTALSPRALLFLQLGAAIVCGCFFTGQNIAYRGIFLLFVLPCLLGLGRLSVGAGTARMFRMTAYATLYALWMVLIQRGVSYFFGGSFFPVQGSAVGYAAWILRELVWWWIVTVLLAVLIRLVLDSPSWRGLPRLVRGTTTPPR